MIKWGDFNQQVLDEYSKDMKSGKKIQNRTFILNQGDQ